MLGILILNNNFIIFSNFTNWIFNNNNNYPGVPVINPIEIDNNVFNNDRKSAYLHSSKIHILNCILLLFISSVIFSINYINNEKEEIYNIKITNYMSDKKIPPPPPRPQEPRVIKENQQPVRPGPRPTPPSRPTPSPKK